MPPVLKTVTMQGKDTVRTEGTGTRPIAFGSPDVPLIVEQERESLIGAGASPASLQDWVTDDPEVS